MPGSTQVLLVMQPEKRCPLLQILESLAIQVHTAGGCREARGVFATHAGIEVVITEITHPDGNWCDLLKCVVEQNIPAGVVVAAREADERLWSEVLWRGAYDLLVEPCRSSEVQRVVEGAARAGWRSKTRERTAAAEPDQDFAEVATR